MRTVGLLSRLFGRKPQSPSSESDDFRARLDDLAAQIKSLPAARHTRTRGQRVMSRLTMPYGGYGTNFTHTDNRFELARSGYRHWSYVAIRKKAEVVAGLEPHVSLTGIDWPSNTPDPGAKSRRVARRVKAWTHQASENELEPVPDSHALCELLRDPNPPDVRWSVWFESIMALELTGNCYWWLPQNVLGKPAEIWVIPPFWVRPRAGEHGEIESYDLWPLYGAGILESLPAEEILHFKYPHPLSKLDGYSPLTAAALWVDLIWSIDQSRWSQFKNGSYPDVGILLDEETVDPDEETRGRIYHAFQSRFQGEVRRGRPLIFGNGIKEVMPLSLTPEEMAYVQSAEQARDQVLSALGVPYSIIQQSDMTYGSVVASQAGFYTSTIKPILTYFEQVLTEKLAARWDRRLRVWWPDPSPDDPAQDLAVRQAMMGAGALTPNEWRQSMGLDAFEHGGDNPVLGGQEMPWGTGEVTPQPEQPGMPPGGGEGGGGGEQPPQPQSQPDDNVGKTLAGLATGAGNGTTRPAVSSGTNGRGVAPGNRIRWPVGAGGNGHAKSLMPAAATVTKENYFSECPRDEGGHCKPSGSGGRSKPARGKPSTKKKPATAPKKPQARRGEMAEARREGTGKEARVVLADGTEAPPHIKAGMVPPDWSSVQVSLDPEADLLVTATDGKGRGKRVYRDDFHMKTAAIKFSRVREGVAKRKAMYKENLANRAGPNREEADCTWLMMEQGTRPGSDEDTGADVKAYGATTLLGQHVHEHQGMVWLDFVGKEGVRHVHKIRNPELAAMLLERKAKAGWDGKLFNTNYGKVARYSSKLNGGKFTPKDFRTVKATTMAVKLVSRYDSPPATEKEYKARVKEVAEKVSGVLGNRPQQALESYIDPVVFSVWRKGNA